MSSSRKFELLLHEALAEPFGIKVDVTIGDRDRARQKFYAARSEHLLTFSEISIIFDPTIANRLWLLNKGGSVAQDS